MKMHISVILSFSLSLSSIFFFYCTCVDRYLYIDNLCIYARKVRLIIRVVIFFFFFFIGIFIILTEMMLIKKKYYDDILRNFLETSLLLGKLLSFEENNFVVYLKKNNFRWMTSLVDICCILFFSIRCLR